MTIEFTVPGKPVPKARARVLRNGWSYTPAKTRKQESLVKLIAISRRNASKISISGGSFRLLIVAYGADPRSDWDNIGKLISDSLNGVLWNDDRQVIDAHVIKLPCPKGQERTEVKIEDLTGTESGPGKETQRGTAADTSGTLSSYTAKPSNPSIS